MSPPKIATLTAPLILVSLKSEVWFSIIRNMDFIMSHIPYINPIPLISKINIGKG
jgi:hypothetical protein